MGNEREERWVVWQDPIGPNSEPVYCKVPESTAIAVQKENAGRQGWIYNNDEEALQDFMIVNLAWFGVPEDDLEKRWKERLKEAFDSGFRAGLREKGQAVDEPKEG